MNINQVTMTMRLGADSEIKYTPAGFGILEFRGANRESWKDKNDKWQEKTHWFKVTKWLKDGENPHYVKGQDVAVMGKLQTREWKDKDGNTRREVDIQANAIASLGSVAPRETNKTEPSSVGFSLGPSTTTIREDDLPF